MFGILASPGLYKQVENLIDLKERQILFKIISEKIDINDMKKASSLSLKHLIIEIDVLINSEEDIEKIIRNYRIGNGDVQIIIIAPNYEPGNVLMHKLVTMGVYDIIAPRVEEGEPIDISETLNDVLDKPTPYYRAVRWDISNIDNNQLEQRDIQNKENAEKGKKEKVKVRIEYKNIIESVFKKTIAIYSPTSEGASVVASQLAYSIAKNGYKVLLVDFNPLKPCQKEIFNIDSKYNLSDFLDHIVKNTLTNVVLEGLAKEYSKNLSILPGLYNLNEMYTSKVEYFEEILEKAKYSFDYVIVDTHSWYDVMTTDSALRLADDIIVPVRGRNHSLDTLDRYIENFNKYNDFDVRKFKILINKYDGNDLTSIEINSKTSYPVIGYISNFKECDKDNGFKSRKVLHQYEKILPKVGINIKNRNKGIFKIFRKNTKGDEN